MCLLRARKRRECGSNGHELIDQKVRLHITPLSSELLSAVLASHTAHLADNISYHTLETFPENNYGYLELPSMEAEKLKKKLNGSILKGKKIRIEEARPHKRAREEADDGAENEPNDASTERGRRPKKIKHDRATVSGHELPPGRKVRRGWTEPKTAKGRKSTKGSSDQAASKYTDKEEVLFRTKLPPNRAKSTKGNSKKDKRKSRDVVVHEFEKSTIHPTFLREDEASDIRKAVEYIDGKGWVNEDGEVVEAECNRQRKKTRHSNKKAEPAGDLSQSKAEPTDDHAQRDDERGSASSSSDSESCLTASSTQGDASKATSVEERETQITPTPSVHPLEAIFKRPSKAASADIAKPSLEVQTSFSFFEPEPEPAVAMPVTPFNSQELRSRELRSAAPTPDTVAPSRFNSWDSHGVNDVESEDEQEEEEDEEEAAATVNRPGAGTPSKAASLGEKGGGESDFAKFFWEHRGENNRTWKRRAREAKKEKRQRENRQQSRRF